MAEFSAKYYQDMSEDAFRAEAKKHGIEYVGPRNNTLVDAVYNAELQRRHTLEAEKRAAAEAKQTEVQDVMDDDNEVDLDDESVDFEMMTNAELRDYAASHNIDVSKAKSKADLLMAIEGAKS